MNILVIGQEDKQKEFVSSISNEKIEWTFSDGDSEEDFDDFEVIFDLNFDDDHENFATYAQLKNTIVFLSAAKQSISEAAFMFDVKVRSFIFGINALPVYLSDASVELSAYRAHEKDKATAILDQLGKKIIWVEDRVGMFRPRCQYLFFNEITKCIEENVMHTSMDAPEWNDYFRQIDTYQITAIFETLMAIYEDTKDVKFLPSQLLKKKYLRNHQLVK
jgi:hypothetical protein